MIGAGIGKFISDVIDLVENKRQRTLWTFPTPQMKTVFELSLSLKKVPMLKN